MRSPQTSTVPPPDAGGGVTVAAALAGPADALEPTDGLAVELVGDVGDVGAAAVAVAGTPVPTAVAFAFVAGLHAVEHNATTATAAAAESARTFIAAPC
ncbi:MAG TPA: hypothetical protein VGD55_15135 [Acidothermaceae bacterium]